ncbi:agamous-like MADS-box protein AGL29 [Papaver somniferum]|uniref:agamous-like MADS-box protein AGL29 n=1 Tax=Papaver somniferum TaxID=3469 RepID=UPI000E6FFDDD|nr:agamous-like MADS-box protein AGL29 [Papaver somniferum]
MMMNQVTMIEMKTHKKGGDGRKRIKIEKIKDKSRLQVTFSKRRKGLFKKATELSILTGAQVALIAFSPAGKPYVCGNPDLLLDRFVNGEASEIHQRDHNDPEQRRYMEVEQELEAEKKRGVFLESLINCDLGVGNDKSWWDTYVDGLSLDELKQMKSDMEQLQKCVAQRSNDLKMNNNTASSSSSYEDKSLALMNLPAGNDDIVDDDYLNEEMVNELVFGFDPQEYDFGTTTSTDQEITADMFSDDYYY